MGGVIAREPDILTRRFSAELGSGGMFARVDGQQVSRALLAGPHHAPTNASHAEGAVGSGKLLGFERVITGEIGRIGDRFAVVSRVVDVKTETILAEASADADGPIENRLKTGMKLNVVALTLAIQQRSKSAHTIVNGTR